MKKFLVLLFTAIMIISISACDVEENVNELKVNRSSSNFVKENYKTVMSEFETIGFTNITTKVLDDLITGWITKDGSVEQVEINGKTEFSANTSFPKDAIIVITYHTFPVDDKKLESTATSSIATSSNATSSTEQEVPQQNKQEEAVKALEITFPVENAKRSAVVAITNWYAADVFKADGNTYDISKFHSYADTTGKVESYFLKITSWGTWSVKDEKAWHVDSLILKNYFGTVINGSLDIKFDGKNYIISNVKGKLGLDTDLSEIEIEQNASIFLIIPPELIKNDRNQAEVKALDHSGDLDNSVARTVFENYGKHEYPYGFKCHWIIDFRSEAQNTDGSWFFKVGVTITNQYGTKIDAIAEGTIGGTTANPIIKEFLVH